MHFVDYGNTDKVCGTHVHPLPLEFCQLPCQALYITIRERSTCGSPCSSPSELIGSVVSVRITACRAPNTFEVTVLNSGKYKKHGSSSTLGCDMSGDVSCCAQLSLPDMTFPFQAVVAHVNSVTDFYIHQLDKGKAERMRRMETDVQQFYSNRSNHNVIDIVKLEPGIIGCVYSVTDGLFCRATVLNVEEDLTCEVQLVDYGHTEKKLAHDILELPLELLHLPVCCIRCQLSFDGEKCSTARIDGLFKQMARCTRVFTVFQGQCSKYMC